MGIITFTEKISKVMNWIAAVALTFIMLLTVADVILRFFKMPIVGTFEMVGLGGAIAVGFAIPVTSFMRGHIFVDFFVNSFPAGLRNTFNFATRLISIAIFVLIGYNMILYAGELHASGEVTLTRHLPFYPIAYGLAVVCFVQVLVLVVDIIKIAGGKYE